MGKRSFQSDGVNEEIQVLFWGKCVMLCLGAKIPQWLQFQQPWEKAPIPRSGQGGAFTSEIMFFFVVISEAEILKWLWVQ